MRMKCRKWIALLMAVLMVVSLLPVTAFAAADTSLPLLTQLTNGGYGYGYYITLTNDVELSESYVIDNYFPIIINMNGHTITGKDVPAFDVQSGQLTLVVGTVTSTAAGEDSAVIKLAADTYLYMESDVVVETASAESTIAGSGASIALNNDDSAVKNTKIGGTAIKASDSSISIQKGSVSGNTAVSATSSVLTVYGGNITGETTGISATSSELTVYDGSITGSTGPALALTDCDSEDVAIAGGTFSGAITSTATNEGSPATGFIYGGSFSADPANFLADGAVAEKENNKYTVTLKNYPTGVAVSVTVSGLEGDPTIGMGPMAKPLYIYDANAILALDDHLEVAREGEVYVCGIPNVAENSSKIIAAGYVDADGYPSDNGKTTLTVTFPTSAYDAATQRLVVKAFGVYDGFDYYYPTGDAIKNNGNGTLTVTVTYDGVQNWILAATDPYVTQINFRGNEYAKTADTYTDGDTAGDELISVYDLGGDCFYLNYSFYYDKSAQTVTDDDGHVYRSDANGIMSYFVDPNYRYDETEYDNVGATFDVIGKLGGDWKQVTFKRDGFETYLMVGEYVPNEEENPDPIRVEDLTGNETVKVYDWSGEAGDYVVTEDTGLAVGVDCAVIGDHGQIVKVTYTVKNQGTETKTFSLGSGGDVQIGSDDSAPISPLYVGGDPEQKQIGMTMTSTQHCDLDAEGNAASLAFVCLNNDMITPVDTLWYEYYSDYNKRENMFGEKIETASLTEKDSGMSYSWVNETIASNEVKTYTVMLGIGDMESIMEEVEALEENFNSHIHKDAGGNAITFEPWESDSSLPAAANLTDGVGSFYLTKDVTLNGTWQVPEGTTNLCLNGHVISSDETGSVITVPEGATLNIYDCDCNNGEDTVHYFTYVKNNKWEYLSNHEADGNEVSLAELIAGTNGTLTDGATVIAVPGGVITGGNGQCKTSITGRTYDDYGGGITVFGELHMYGGTIAGNKTSRNNSGNISHGGGVSVMKGTATFTDVAFAGNWGLKGSAINIAGNASVKIFGGSFTNNSAIEGETNNYKSTIYAEGQLTINETGDKRTTFTGNVSMETSCITANASTEKVIINHADFKNNIAQRYGVLEFFCREADVTDCTFIGNRNEDYNGKPKSTNAGICFVRSSSNSDGNHSQVLFKDCTVKENICAVEATTDFSAILFSLEYGSVLTIDGGTIGNNYSGIPCIAAPTPNMIFASTPGKLILKGTPILYDNENDKNTFTLPVRYRWNSLSSTYQWSMVVDMEDYVAPENTKLRLVTDNETVSNLNDVFEDPLPYTYITHAEKAGLSKITLTSSNKNLCLAMDAHDAQKDVQLVYVDAENNADDANKQFVTSVTPPEMAGAEYTYQWYEAEMKNAPCTVLNELAVESIPSSMETEKDLEDYLTVNLIDMLSDSEEQLLEVTLSEKNNNSYTIQAPTMTEGGNSYIPVLLIPEENSNLFNGYMAFEGLTSGSQPEMVTVSMKIDGLTGNEEMTLVDAIAGGEGFYAPLTGSDGVYTADVPRGLPLLLVIGTDVNDATFTVSDITFGTIDVENRVKLEGETKSTLDYKNEKVSGGKAYGCDVTVKNGDLNLESTLMTNLLEAPAVAQIVGGAKYTNLEAALKAAEESTESQTVVLLKDLTGNDKVDLIEVAPDVTLDLNGYDLEAKYAIVFGMIRGNGFTGSKLIVPQNGLAYMGGGEINIATTKDYLLPVWNNNGYVFCKAEYLVREWQYGLGDATHNPKFRFQPQSGEIANILANGSGVRVFVEFTYTKTEYNEESGQNESHDYSLTVEFGRSFLTQFLADHTGNIMYVSLLGTDGVTQITARAYLTANNGNFIATSNPLTTQSGN